METDNPDLLRRPTTDPSEIGSLRDRAIGIIAFAAVLALLYVGRGVLIPLTIALMLSLLIAPLVRRLRRIGLGQTPSVLVAVLTLALVVTAAAGVLGTQVLRMAASLPHYERTIQQKLRNLDEMTVGRLDALTSEASRLIESHPSGVASTVPSGTGDLSSGAVPIPVELHQPRPPPCRPLQEYWHRSGFPSRPPELCWSYSCSCCSSTNLCATASSVSPVGPTYG